MRLILTLITALCVPSCSTPTEQITNEQASTQNAQPMSALAGNSTSNEPQPACDNLAAVVGAAQTGCNEPTDCEVRTGMCGCPIAVLTTADQSAIDALLRSCDYGATCKVIDCAVGLAATCNAGTCELR